MEQCISDDAVEVDKEFLDFSYDQAANELKDLAEGMEKSDVQYIKTQMAPHAVPQCFGLVKDHQPDKMDDEGNFPTRFVVPDNNFMAGFANVGYRLIKGIFAKYGVEYSACTIKNADDLLRYLKIDRDLLDHGKCTFVSLDAIKMYPLIKIKTISRAVHFFAKDLPVHEKEKVDKGLELLILSLKSTFFTFVGKYYHYTAGVEDKDEDDIGLTIGGCALAWLADLVISWIFYKNKKFIESTAITSGMYRDDGFLAKDSECMTKEPNKWLAKFQNKKVNRMCGLSHLKFKMVVWANGRNVGPKYKRVKVHSGDSFPYLDTKIWYSEDSCLKWGLYKKPNQVLKYLNGGSTHTQACKDAIAKGVFNRAVRLTYLEEKDCDTPVNELFDEQARALEVAQVAPTPYLMVYQVAQRLWKNAHRKDSNIQIPPKFKSKVDSDDDSSINPALIDEPSSTTSNLSISSNDSTVVAANTKAAKKKSKRKRRARKKKRKRKPREVNFVIPYSKFWSGEPIHTVIK